MSRTWYPLDGTWHNRVSTRLSVLHLPETPEKIGGAICDPSRTMLLDDMPYEEAEALASGRCCKRCLATIDSGKAS